MLYYPDVQRKAQEELDRLLGGRRLPEFKDEESFPYVSAVVKELLRYFISSVSTRILRKDGMVSRWQPVGPLGIPHYTSEDDVYKGYFIPKGSIVVSNIWSVIETCSN